MLHVRVPRVRSPGVESIASGVESIASGVESIASGVESIASGVESIASGVDPEGHHECTPPGIDFSSEQVKSSESPASKMPAAIR